MEIQLEIQMLQRYFFYLDMIQLYATAPTKEEVLGEDIVEDNSTGLYNLYR